MLNAFLYSTLVIDIRGVGEGGGGQRCPPLCMFNLRTIVLSFIINAHCVCFLDGVIG